MFKNQGKSWIPSNRQQNRKLGGNMKALGNTLNRNLIASLGRLWEILKTTSLIVIAVAVGLALGQLH
jgi:hypothetical protein